MFRIPQPLDQQVIVVAGASSEISLATVKIAAAQQAKVVVIARSRGVLAGMVDEIVEDGGKALYLVADVAERTEIERAACVVIDYFGRIDTWVNDTGIFVHGQLDEITETDSRRLFDTSFWGTVNGSLAALPYLKKSRGALINIGSEIAEVGLPMHGMYSAAKQAIKGFTDTLRMEVEVLDKAPVAIRMVEPLAVISSVLEHNAPHSKHDSHLSGPQINLLRVADAILHTATHAEQGGKMEVAPTPDFSLGKVSSLMTDKLAARQQGSATPRKATALHAAHPRDHEQAQGEQTLKYLRR